MAENEQGDAVTTEASTQDVAAEAPLSEVAAPVVAAPVTTVPSYPTPRTIKALDAKVEALDDENDLEVKTLEEQVANLNNLGVESVTDIQNLKDFAVVVQDRTNALTTLVEGFNSRIGDSALRVLSLENKVKDLEALRSASPEGLAERIKDLEARLGIS